MNKLLENIGQENVNKILGIRESVFEPLFRNIVLSLVTAIRLRIFEYLSKAECTKKKELFVLAIEFSSIIDLIYNLSDERWGDQQVIDRIKENISKYGVTLENLFDKQIFDLILR